MSWKPVSGRLALSVVRHNTMPSNLSFKEFCSFHSSPCDLPATVQSHYDLVHGPFHKHGPRCMEDLMYVKVEVGMSAHKDRYVILPPAFEDCGGIHPTVVPVPRRCTSGWEVKGKKQTSSGMFDK